MPRLDMIALREGAGAAGGCASLQYTTREAVQGLNFDEIGLMLFDADLGYGRGT